MSWSLVFHPDVREEVHEAYRHYEKRVYGLGDDFLEAIEEGLDRLRQTPEAHQVIYRNVRRALPRRFPYCIYYRIHSDRVEIIAIQHGRRNPKDWQARL